MCMRMMEGTHCHYQFHSLYDTVTCPIYSTILLPISTFFYLKVEIIKIILHHTFVVGLCSFKLTGSRRTATLTPIHEVRFVGRLAMFSKRGISASKTVAKTVCLCGHSSWSTKLMKKSGPVPTQPTMPLLIAGCDSLGIFLNGTYCTSNVPWSTAYGGPVLIWTPKKK